MAGRPPFVPTEEQRMRVKVMVGCGVSQAVICAQTINTTTGNPIDLKTLRKVFRTELDAGAEFANGLVTQALFKHATGNGRSSVTACIFWLKARAGWKDKTHIELNGNVGTEPTKDAKDMTPEELAAELRKHGIDPESL